MCCAVRLKPNQTELITVQQSEKKNSRGERLLAAHAAAMGPASVAAARCTAMRS